MKWLATILIFLMGMVQDIAYRLGIGRSTG